MKYLTYDSFNLCSRWGRPKRWLYGALGVLLALGMQGIVSATSLSGVKLVSVNKDGTDSGNGSSERPVISADGRFVAFVSEASDLVATDTNDPGFRGSDIFVRDLQSGTTTLVSVNKDGTDSGNNRSSVPVISADGRFVAFLSDASDLVAADNNGAGDVFVRDLQSGTTTLVSVNKDGTDSGNGFSGGAPAISADGRFVAFTSSAHDLVATDTNSIDVWNGGVFVRDLRSGTTTLVSVNKDGTDSGNSGSGGPVISADGRFVAFGSTASDLVAIDSDYMPNVYVRDLQRGTTTLVSVNTDGTDSGNNASWVGAISADGRFVAFESYASNLLAADSNGTGDVFVRDLQSGTTTLVSVNKEGTDSGNSGSGGPVISADGRFVAFNSDASDLVATDTNGPGFWGSDIFVRDLQSSSTTLVSVNKDGTDSGNGRSLHHVISADGRFVAFNSDASDLVAMDTNSIDVWNGDAFVRDLRSGTTTLVSVNKDGTHTGNSYSAAPVISADGRFMAFQSSASDLVATDTNGTYDIFVFDQFATPQGCNCADPSAIQGTAGPDFLYGTEQTEIICGLGGDDFIAGMGGDDCIDGGDGNDWVYGGGGDDRIFGRAGRDVIYGARGNDEISGDEGRDFLFGGAGDDKLDGGEGYDRLFCGSGTDEGIGEYVRRCEN
jgi:Tol biopolymer transport system component